MSLDNLQMFQPLHREMVYNHRQATPLRAPPSALSRNISRSAEILVATTRCGKELKSRKTRSTEQPGVGGLKTTSGLPALVKNWPSDEINFKSSSRNGSTESIFIADMSIDKQRLNDPASSSISRYATPRIGCNVQIGVVLMLEWKPIG
ncbi:unnamed protein product, partial [Iphiclides podalirius]